jgi:hypothetical protein
MKYFLVLITLLLLTGCKSYTEFASYCYTNDYKGMVVSDSSSITECSNGERSPRGCFIALDGEHCDNKYSKFYYVEFTDPRY